MAIIKGNDVLFSYWDEADQELKAFACARSITINMTAELIGKSTAGSGNWKEKEMAVMSWDFIEEGVQYLDVPGQMSVTDIIDLFLAGQPVVVSLYSVDETGSNEYYLNGNAIITQVSVNAAVNNMASINITGEGTGPLVKDGPAEYGNYPTGFEIITENADTPVPGQTTLTFFWDEPVPIPDTYTVEVTDTIEGTSVEYDNILDYDGFNVVVYTDHNYTFRVKSVYFDGNASSNYSPSISWPEVANIDMEYITDSDGVTINDTDNQTIEDN